MEKSLRVLIIATGVKSQQILGEDFKAKDKSGNISDELGIEFLE
jgi:hypothetical protein